MNTHEYLLFHRTNNDGNDTTRHLLQSGTIAYMSINSDDSEGQSTRDTNILEKHTLNSQTDNPYPDIPHYVLDAIRITSMRNRIHNSESADEGMERKRSLLRGEPTDTLHDDDMVYEKWDLALAVDTTRHPLQHGTSTYVSNKSDDREGQSTRDMHILQNSGHNVDHEDDNSDNDVGENEEKKKKKRRGKKRNRDQRKRQKHRNKTPRESS